MSKKTIIVTPKHRITVQRLDTAPRTVATTVRERPDHQRTPEAVMAEAEALVREIHRHLKRGAGTSDHGLIGNLKCILDHVCRDGDPVPL